MIASRRAWTLLVLTAVVLAASACASRPSTIRVLPPRPVPGPETIPPATVERPSTEGSAPGAAIARTAETLLGLPYRDGGALPDGFDCSGLVNYVFARHGIDVPRDVRRQASTGMPVDRGDVAPGDLVFFATTGAGPTHVGIAIGGARFIHAPKSGGLVRIESMATGYWASRFVTARRVPVPGV